MRPVNKAKALELIDSWLGVIDDGLTENGDFQYALLEIRELIVEGDELEISLSNQGSGG